HQVEVTFTAPATVSSATCDGKPATTSSTGNDVIVNCTGVPNQKTISVALTGVTVASVSGDLSVPMGVLLGDTNADGSVDGTDVSQTKAQSGNAAAAAGSVFREDINLDGFIDGTDVSFVKSRSGDHIP